MTYTIEERLAIVEAKSIAERATITAIVEVRKDLSETTKGAREHAATRIAEIRAFAKTSLKSETERIIAEMRADTETEPETDEGDNDE